MKLMRWMTVTALATATVFGSFIESAEAITIDGISTRGSKSDETSLLLNYEFTIFSKTPTGATIRDTDSDTTMGKFPNAVENFIGGICDSRDIFLGFENLLISESDGCGDSPNIDFQDKIPNPLTLDLKARLISAGEAITLPNDQQVFETEDGGGTIQSTGFRKAENDRIEYVLTNNDLKEDFGIAELALIISDLSSIDGLDPTKAVNSLDFIVENQLLGKVDRIRISGEPSENNILELENVEELGGMIPEIVSSESSINGEAEVMSITVTVPESSSKNSLLVLGILGAGIGLKRRLK